LYLAGVPFGSGIGAEGPVAVGGLEVLEPDGGEHRAGLHEPTRVGGQLAQDPLPLPVVAASRRAGRYVRGRGRETRHATSRDLSSRRE